jgi:hypothetical protein
VDGNTIDTYWRSASVSDFPTAWLRVDLAAVIHIYEFEVYSGPAATPKGGNKDFVEAAVPDEFTLEQNYPKPFNPSTQIRFGLPSRLAGSHVTIKLYTIDGKEVKTLVKRTRIICMPGPRRAKGGVLLFFSANAPACR